MFSRVAPASSSPFPDGICVNELTDGTPAPVLRDALIIDDSEDFRVLLFHHLQALYPGIVVTPYDPPSRGRPGDDFPWSGFDLVVVDYELGNGENGLDWLRDLRDIPRFPPVIVMTAHGDEELAVRAMKSGAQYYLSKLSYDRNRLACAISEVVREREEENRQSASAALRLSVFDKAQFYARLEEALGGSGPTAHRVMVLVSIDDLEELQQLLGLLEMDNLIAHLGETVAAALQRQELQVNVTRVADGAVAEHGDPPRVPDLLVEPEGRRTLDRWVIRNSLGRVLQMVARGVRRGGLLVRLSEESLSDTSFKQWLQALVEHVKAPRVMSGVVFELRAEDVLGLNPRAASVMKHLRDDHGAKFALLDIPSASVLRSCQRHAPYAFVKLIAPGSGNERSAAWNEFEFAEAVRMSHQMGAFVVAERVERAEQLAMAIQHGVDFAQGYFIQDPQENIADSGPIEAVNLDDTWKGSTEP
jgi:EAL domain-containing protein (putative c-di-GMP-specific phosphodiesterase class I)